MSIGTEDVKGNDFTKEVFKMLKQSALNFRGNVEGHDLFEHPVEVVVCDGFIGNIVLKTCEAIARRHFQMAQARADEEHQSAWPAPSSRKAPSKPSSKKMNSDEYGGMPLLGVNGICIIAHGASSPLAMKNAIRMAGRIH